jgi:hypothetical protein
MYIFKSINLLDFVIFFIAHNTKNFILKLSMLIGYIIDYV